MLLADRRYLQKKMKQKSPRQQARKASDRRVRVPKGFQIVLPRASLFSGFFRLFRNPPPRDVPDPSRASPGAPRGTIFGIKTNRKSVANQ